MMKGIQHSQAICAKKLTLFVNLYLKFLPEYCDLNGWTVESGQQCLNICAFVPETCGLNQAGSIQSEPIYQ